MPVQTRDGRNTQMKKQMAWVGALLAVMLLLPLMGLAEREFAVDAQVERQDGFTTVRWSDSEEGHTYVVGYEPYAGNDTAQTAFWAGGDREASTTTERQFTFSTLLPGHAYTVEIMDDNGGHVAEVLTIPEAPAFTDGRLTTEGITVTIDGAVKPTLFDRPRGEKMPLSAADILSTMGQREYGLIFNVRLPVLSSSRTYLVQVAITAPNGYTETVICQNYTFRGNTDRPTYSLYTGFDYIRRMYEKTGEVPTGVYTTELFFNGMPVYTKNFQIL